MALDVSKIPNNSKFDPVREAILDLQAEISSGVAGVSSLNNQTGAVTIAQGSNVSITTNNGVITISSTASGGGTLDGELTLAAGNGIQLSSPSVFDGSTDLTVTITNTEIPNDGVLTFSAGAGLTIAGGPTWTEIVDNWSIETQTWGASVGATFSANALDDANINIQHGDTSSVANVVNVGGNVLQSMGFDEFGHVQSTASTNLDNRYLAFRTIFTEDDGGSLSAQTYNDTLTLNGSPSISVTTDTVNDQIYFALSLNDISFDPDGNLIARGLLYYQEVGEPSISDLPTATFNFENATIDLSGPNANKWSENAPRTGTALTTLWVVRYQSIDTGAGTSAARTVTFGSIIEATGFEGPVTFSDFESGGRTIIDGGRIQTGSISSNGFQVGSTPTDFSTEGTKWFLEGNGQNNGGDIISEQFKITSGNAAFKGDVTGASGTFGTVDFNKNGYLINAAGFQLDLNGAVTIGGSKFNIPVYADDAIGTNKSFTLQAGQEYVLFYASNVPQDQLDINTVTGTWVKFIGDDGATGATGTAGLSTFLASIYRRSSSAPATPTGGSYNFGNTTLTPPSGWSTTVPSGDDPIYVSTALASIQGITGIDSSLSWSSPVIFAQNGEDGSAGTNARAVNLIAEDQSFEYSTLGTNPSPATAIVTASPINTTGTVYYQFFLNDVSQQNTTSNTYNYTAPASYVNMPQKIEVQIREGSSTAPILARDQITMFGIKAGSDAYTIILTNEAHTLPTTNTGVVTYTGSGTSIIVYKGTTELNGITSGTPTTGQFRVTAVGTNITVGSITSVGNPVVIGNHSNMTADLASVALTINVENVSTFSKTQSLSKSKEGEDGAVGPAGPEGPQGPQGTAGNNGVKTATGIIFYQFGSSTTPTTPSASYFNFSTGQFVGLTSGWATTTPQMEAGTSTNRYWSAYYSVSESFAGSGISNSPVTFTTPERAFSFNQVVTFDSLSSSGTTIINGDNITTGVISSADYVSQSGSVFSASGMAIDLLNDSIETPNFAVDTNGDAFFSAGKIQIGSNKIVLQADNFYSALGTIEFQNETGDVAADMKVTSYGTNEVTLASYVFGTFKGNQLIVGEDRFYLGRSGGSFIEEDSSNYLRLFGAVGIKMISLPFLSTSANMYVNPSTGQIYRTTSSLKYKKDIEDYTRGIEDVKKLRPVSFKSINQDSDTVYAGFIAEEVHDAGLTEYVDYNENNEPDAIHYSNLVTLLIKGMQEQQEQIDLLKSEIENLKNKA